MKISGEKKEIDEAKCYMITKYTTKLIVLLNYKEYHAIVDEVNTACQFNYDKISFLSYEEYIWLATNTL